MKYSLPLDVVRYRNGSFVKLTASALEFISYNYDPDTDTGSYTPASIVITAQINGNLAYKKWQYRKGGSDWEDIEETNDLGITITSASLTILPTSSLFDKTNTSITIKCVAADKDSGEELSDTVGISRIVDYIMLYRKQQTDIDQTSDKIALIASDEQLRDYGITNTVVSDLAAVKVTAGRIESEVSEKVGETEVRSLISQSTDSIRLLAKTLTWVADNSSLTEAGVLTVAAGLIGGWTLQNNELFAGSASGTYIKLNPSLLETRSADSYSYLYNRIRNGAFETAAQGKSSGSITTTTVYGPAYSSSDKKASGSVACYRAWSLMRSGGGSLVHRFCGGDSYLNSAAFWYGLPVYMKSSLKVAGTKSREATTEDYGDRLLYSYEMPSPMFGDVGEGVIGEDGKAYIAIDPVFVETVTLSQYQVFLQKYGSGDAYVAERKPSHFVVEGTPGLSFGWELKAKQKGFEQQRLDKDVTFGGSQEAYGEYGSWHVQDVNEERMNTI